MNASTVRNMLCASLLLVASTLALAIGPAKYYIRSTASGGYLQADGIVPGNEAGVYVGPHVDRASAVWEAVPVPSLRGYYYLKSEAGRYLDVQQASPVNGTPVWLYNFNGSVAQRWRVTPTDSMNPNSPVTIQSPLGTYLTVKWDNLGTWMYSSFKQDGVEGPRQTWSLLDAGTGHPLSGFVDMHTHPMAHLGFGGKLVHGSPDVNTLMPAIPSGNGCQHYAYPKSIAEALSSDNVTHGGWGLDNTCGDSIRKEIVRTTEAKLGAKIAHAEDGASGYPWLNKWPAQNDLTHQQMWIDWIRRAHEVGGLNAMVSLAVNNEALAHAVMGPNDINGDDVSSMNVQIDEMVSMVKRHSDFMAIAKTPAELRNIVASGKLAIVLGVEIDNLGNLHRDPRVDPQLGVLNGAYSKARVTAVLDSLHAKGIRYVFPIHLSDNKTGGTGVYSELFNISNRYTTGSWWSLECAGIDRDITFKFTPSDSLPLAAVQGIKLGIWDSPSTPPDCSSATATSLRRVRGHVNTKGLTPLGEFAINEMMRRGMLIDIDHMSEKSANRAIELAKAIPYPLNSGHNAPRSLNHSENGRTDQQYKDIVSLGGMIGLGHGGSATAFVETYNQVATLIGSAKPIAIGTDGNVLNPLPGPDANAPLPFPYTYTFGYRMWNFNTEGMAHYGLYPEFIRSLTAVRTVPMTPAQKSVFMTSVDYFAHMWERAERNRLLVK